MKTKLIALSTAAVMAFGAPALAQDTFDMGFNMMTGAIYNSLARAGIPTDGIQNLSLGQLVEIKTLLDDATGESDALIRQRISQIMERQ